MRMLARWIMLPVLLIGCAETATNPEPVRVPATRLINLQPAATRATGGARIEDDGEGLRTWRMVYDNTAKDESWASAFLSPTFTYHASDYSADALLDAPDGQPLQAFFPAGCLGVDQLRVTATATMTPEGIWAVDFGPSPYKFRKPVSLIVHYGGLRLTGIAPSSLHIVWFNPDTGVWEPMQTQVDEVAQVAVAQVSHFSRYGLTGDILPDPIPLDSLHLPLDSLNLPRPGRPIP